MKRVSIAAGILFVCLLVSNLNAEMYFWTDKNGVKHFSAEPPPDEQNAGDMKAMESYTYNESAAEAAPAEDDASHSEHNNSFEKKQAQEISGEIVMFSTPQCGYCNRAKAFFATHHINYTDYDITTSEDGLRRYKELKGSGVPLILIGDKRINGYSEQTLRKTLGMSSD
ncbi:MAG: hypothetical protein BWK80_15865 [Desulfobacteraceae bacterium IS3]|nr:MAG: hypothetical protein BWK80_15865 [Desulfobacteraceae bacterium IS3]